MHRYLLVALLPLGGCFGKLFGGGDDDTNDDIPYDELDKGAKGDLGSVWRPMAGQVDMIDPSNPYAMQSAALQLPGVLAGDDDREVEIFVQLDGDTLVTWAHVDGDAFHWRITQSLVAADGTWVGVLGNTTRTLTLEDGHLVEQVVGTLGGVTTMSSTTYGAVAGDFPPAAWPTKRVDADLPGGF